MFAAAAAAALALPGVGQAQSLQGDEISCEVTGSGSLFCNQGTATVGNGREFVIQTSNNNVFGINFSDDQLRINSLGTTAIGGSLFLNFRNLTEPFTDFALLENQGIAGFTASDVTLNANGRLRIDLSNTASTENGLIRLALVTASAVPEPSTWAMLLFGFGAVGYSMRTRTQRRPALV